MSFPALREHWQRYVGACVYLRCVKLVQHIAPALHNHLLPTNTPRGPQGRQRSSCVCRGFCWGYILGPKQDHRGCGSSSDTVLVCRLCRAP
jgi:hypothetical protein